MILPYSLVSVEPGADRYSEQSQLWLDSDECYWIITYQAAQSEWIASKLGRNHEQAKTVLASALAQITIAERVLAAVGDKTCEEIWSVINQEEGVDCELVLGSPPEEFYALVKFKDGSKLRALHPASIHSKQSQLVTLIRT